jgi:hypothetical protein
MSSNPSSDTAEQRFRQAFERLKTDKPNVLAAGTPVSQNNVAKEASCDPSALRKSRFPSLIREIQAYVELHQDQRPSKRQVTLRQRKATKDQKGRIEELVQQRDCAQSQLASANRRIVELCDEVQMLRARLEEVVSTAKVVKI